MRTAVRRAVLATARIGRNGAPLAPPLQRPRGQPDGRAGGRQTRPGGARLGDPLAHLDAPLVGEGASAGSSQIARTFFWSNSNAAASARARSLRCNSRVSDVDLLALRPAFGALGGARQGLVRPPTGRPPRGDLLGKEPLAAAVFAQLQFVEDGRLHHHAKLLRAAQGSHRGRRGGRQAPLATGGAAPAVEGVARDTGLLHQLRHADVVGRQHLHHDAVLELFRIGFQRSSPYS